MTHAPHTWETEEQQHHVAEGISLAIYATIVLTAILVALGEDGDEPEVIVVELVGTAVVLFLAHSFSAFLGWRRTRDQTPTFRETVQIVGDQWPVLAAAVVPQQLSASLLRVHGRAARHIRSRSATHSPFSSFWERRSGA